MPAVIEQMIDSLGTRGRACSVGAPAPGKRASVDVFSHLVMGREYVGCHQGESIAKEVRFLADECIERVPAPQAVPIPNFLQKKLLPELH